MPHIQHHLKRQKQHSTSTQECCREYLRISFAACRFDTPPAAAPHSRGTRLHSRDRRGAARCASPSRSGLEWMLVLARGTALAPSLSLSQCLYYLSSCYGLMRTMWHRERQLMPLQRFRGKIFLAGNSTRLPVRPARSCTSKSVLPPREYEYQAIA